MGDRRTDIIAEEQTKAKKETFTYRITYGRYSFVIKVLLEYRVKENSLWEALIQVFLPITTEQNYFIYQTLKNNYVTYIEPLLSCSALEVCGKSLDEKWGVDGVALPGLTGYVGDITSITEFDYNTLGNIAGHVIHAYAILLSRVLEFNVKIIGKTEEENKQLLSENIILDIGDGIKIPVKRSFWYNPYRCEIETHVALSLPTEKNGEVLHSLVGGPIIKEAILNGYYNTVYIEPKIGELVGNQRIVEFDIPFSVHREADYFIKDPKKTFDGLYGSLLSMKEINEYSYGKITKEIRDSIKNIYTTNISTSKLAKRENER